MNLTIKEIAKVVGALNEIQGFGDFQVRNIEFDSREIKAGDLFLPLKGQRDGHDFIPTAFANGALATFSEKEITDGPYILVKDAKIAFQTLANYYLKKLGVEVIAVTGSNGKTTTKDMTAAVLSTTFRTYKTQGNYNSEIGAPYTVLHMPEDTEKLVLEMGMDRPGDIDTLSKMAEPKIGLITLIGESHLEFFGSRREIARGKMGMTAGLKPENLLIAPADPIIDEFIPENQNIKRFGLNRSDDLFITAMAEHRDYLTFTANFLDDAITIPFPGKFNATNAMLAAYVGTLEGVSLDNIKQALASVELTKNRTEWKKAAIGADLLSDVYNANPTAMRLILETFQAIPKNVGGRKLAVLADMLELGENSAQMHADMAESIDFEKLDEVYLYGPMMKYLADKIPAAHYYDNYDELEKAIINSVRAKDQVLLKGSNSMGLAKLVDKLVKGLSN